VSTAYTVESTVRQAVDIGFEVTVAGDACSTGTERQHLAALEAMRPLAAIKTVDEVLADPLISG
jgi:biuret amidohydrolase